MTKAKGDEPCTCSTRWQKAALAALIGLSGMDTKAKSEIASKLDGIQSAIVEISKSVAVAVQRIEDHDRRIQNLETLYLRQPEK